MSSERENSTSFFHIRPRQAAAPTNTCDVCKYPRPEKAPQKPHHPRTHSIKTGVNPISLPISHPRPCPRSAIRVKAESGSFAGRGQLNVPVSHICPCSIPSFFPALMNSYFRRKQLTKQQRLRPFCGVAGKEPRKKGSGLTRTKFEHVVVSELPVSSTLPRSITAQNRTSRQTGTQSLFAHRRRTFVLAQPTATFREDTL